MELCIGYTRKIPSTDSRFILFYGLMEEFANACYGSTVSRIHGSFLFLTDSDGGRYPALVYAFMSTPDPGLEWLLYLDGHVKVG
jgi:hypothetical protein